VRQRGTGCIYQQHGSRNLWIKYHRNGKPFRESTHTADRKKAEQKLKQRLAEIATGQFTSLRVDRIRVCELADDFLRDYRINGRKSIEDAKARWNLHLQPFFGTYRAVDVSSDLIARYVDKRQQQRAKNGSVNRELAALKRMFRLGQQATPPKVLRVPAFPILQENNIRKGFLEDSEYRKLVTASPELWFRALVELGRTYGWRVSELLGLRVKQVDLLVRTIRLEPGTTKNRDGREVSMTTAVFELLKQCLHNKAAESYVFTRSNGKPIRDFRGTWASACEAAGVPGLLFHDLRRTAARNLRRAGIAEGVIMRIGGWRTRSVFERYAIVSQQDIADAMRKLENTENSHSSSHSQPESSPVAVPESVQ
jgi:integrase